MNDTYLYPWGPKDARNRNEIVLWRESYRANVACRQAIEDAIRQNFDGMNLSSDCLKPVLEEYGYKRTAWVLANTLHELKSDGRFSQSISSGRGASTSPRIPTTTATSQFAAILPCWTVS